jgi:inosine-uridine nucleoside N-ribohydrolase
MWSDIDDALALAMIHALQDRSEMKLLAVTISTRFAACASYVDLINTWYGRADVPIGMVANGITLESIRSKLPSGFLPVTRYTEHLAELTTDEGGLVYPRRWSGEGSLPDATRLLRQTLAAQSDRSVVILEVGYHTNLAQLLASSGDAHSSLGGRELVAKKVRQLVVMAGSFRSDDPQDASRIEAFPKQDPEFNLVVDIPAAQTVFAEWPTPIVVSGLEIGLAMRFPPESVLNDFGYAPDHPIAHTYRLFADERRMRQPSTPWPHSHPTFDLTVVLYAARPDRGYFSLSSPGRIDVLADGSTHYEPVADGNHQYLILNDEQKSRTLEAMVMLTSQPPVRRR